MGLIVFEMYYKKSPYKVDGTAFEILQNIHKGLDKYYNKDKTRTPAERELKTFLKKCLTYQQKDRYSATYLLNDTWLTESSINDKKRILKIKARTLILSANKKLQKHF